jgi:hypothetical protein
MSIDYIDTDPASQVDQYFDAEAEEKKVKRQQVLGSLQGLHPDSIVDGYTAYNQRQLALDLARGGFYPTNDGEEGGALILEYSLINPDLQRETHQIIINEKTKPNLPNEVLSIVDVIGAEAMAKPVVDRYPDEVVSQNYWG